MSCTWNVESYSEFLEIRTRPARDLLAVIPDSFHPATVVDLGCGPGNSTILLKERWPEADVSGLDSSPEMITAARAAYPDIFFVEITIEDFKPEHGVDCLFANASLQWVQQHETVIPKLFSYVKDGGVFGIQMPNNFHQPAHQVTINILQHHPQWKSLTNKLLFGEMQKPLYYLPAYYDIFMNAGASHVLLWETEYYQEMSDYDGIFDWVKSTALRDMLAAMDQNNQQAFRALYIEAISKSYSRQNNHKVLLPFKRVFVVAFK